ncbi:solute carrier family 15 member 2-like [Rhincodon typus]|uniref:solute carrier family 15 member 2-like n=1 Tax=Rhincodon typus TaxID=259920 RepID=UPI002030B1AC|nr:solute carrier family 15 member 2-like [Rhincodon typus]
MGSETGTVKDPVTQSVRNLPLQKKERHIRSIVKTGRRARQSLDTSQEETRLSHKAPSSSTGTEEKGYRMYFSFFYFSMNLAALLAGIIIPILREDVQCFDSDCYPLAFGVPAITMLLALVIFALGTPEYKIHPPTGNLFCKLLYATGSAIANKIKWYMSKKKGGAKEHWLDWADQKYEKEIINDVKRLYNVLALYPLLPMYWALYEQQGSRWTLQAQEMDRNVGSIRLKPDQLQILNVLFVLLLLPLFEGFIYPQLEKRKLLIQ